MAVCDGSSTPIAGSIQIGAVVDRDFERQYALISGGS